MQDSECEIMSEWEDTSKYVWDEKVNERMT